MKTYYILADHSPRLDAPVVYTTEQRKDGTRFVQAWMATTAAYCRQYAKAAIKARSRREALKKWLSVRILPE